MKDHPYFKVGERVMIFNESYPELNGEDEIYEVMHEFAETVDRVTSKTVSCAFTKSKFAYKLNTLGCRTLRKMVVNMKESGRKVPCGRFMSHQLNHLKS